ncbi:MAG: hypothetical protein R3248_01385 [Candidatus Promineifilaceae bacterium]|nr:hypothetical protein [Candidatus Promineifilaceae bacterium]
MDSAKQRRARAEKSISNLSGSFPLELILAGLALLLLTYVLWQLPYFGDWEVVYYAAGRSVVDPYTVPGFFNAPWLAWILAPFTLFPLHLSGTLWMVLSTVVGLWCIHRLGGGIPAAALCLLSPAYIRFITSGQVDAVPLLGFVLLLTVQELSWAGLGIALVLVKPQVFGAGLLTYWVNLERKEKLFILWLPVLLLVLSFALYGFWPLQMGWQHLTRKVDVTPWPYGIPIGLALLAWSIRQKEPALGGFSTFFLVPYASPSSVFAYTAVLFSLAPRWLSVITFLFLWLMALTIM